MYNLKHLLSINNYNQVMNIIILNKYLSFLDDFVFIKVDIYNIYKEMVY